MMSSADSFGLPLNPHHRLVLVGGGVRPAQAMSRFVEWAGGASAKLLVISWAGIEAEASFESLKKDLAPYHIHSIVQAPQPPFVENSLQVFREQLSEATGVFFTGGQQSRVMDLLDGTELLSEIRKRFHAGVVFGGTSAGTAIMSKRMLTGKANLKVIDASQVETREGLGLLPDHVLVDQHFVMRSRENRLFSLMLQGPETLGLGIDESTAILIDDDERAEVVGATGVMVIETSGARDTLMVRYLKEGQYWSLRPSARATDARSSATTKRPELG